MPIATPWSKPHHGVQHRMIEEDNWRMQFTVEAYDGFAEASVMDLLSKTPWTGAIETTHKDAEAARRHLDNVIEAMMKERD